MHSVDKKSTLYIVKTDPKRPDKDAFKRVFAERLKQAREDTIFSQADVGKAIGMSGNSYSKYEQGDTMLQPAYWAAVCEKLYIDPWQLLTGRPLHKVPSIPAHHRSTAKAGAKRA